MLTKPQAWYKSRMSGYLNQLFADDATALVEENFTGVRAEWWWERRLGGGIAVCQVLDPASMAREVSERVGREAEEVERVAGEDLGLEDLEPVVLTFELPGDTATGEAARMLAERSATPRGLADGLYRQVEEKLG